MGRLTLVLGGARSGKTRFATQLAIDAGQPVLYVATAEAGDGEMAARIARHRAERAPAWRTLELPRGLDQGLAPAVDTESIVLIDCLSVWLSNELLAARDWPASDQEQPAVIAEPAAREMEERLLSGVERLVEYATGRRGPTIVVSSEVGSGIVPAYPLGRLYRDILGRANQLVAERAAAVFLVVAGIGVDLRHLHAAFGRAGGVPHDPDR